MAENVGLMTFSCQEILSRLHPSCEEEKGDLDQCSGLLGLKLKKLPTERLVVTLVGGVCEILMRRKGSNIILYTSLIHLVTEFNFLHSEMTKASVLKLINVVLLNLFYF